MIVSDDNIVDLAKIRAKAEADRKKEEDRQERNRKLILSHKPREPEAQEDFESRLKLTKDSIARINRVVALVKEQHRARSNVRIDLDTGAINDKRQENSKDEETPGGTSPEIEE